MKYGVAWLLGVPVSITETIITAAARTGNGAANL